MTTLKWPICCIETCSAIARYEINGQEFCVPHLQHHRQTQKLKDHPIDESKVIDISFPDKLIARIWIAQGLDWKPK